MHRGFGVALSSVEKKTRVAKSYQPDGLPVFLFCLLQLHRPRIFDQEAERHLASLWSGDVRAWFACPGVFGPANLEKYFGFSQRGARVCAGARRRPIPDPG